MNSAQTSKDAAKQHVANLRSIANYLDPKLGTHTAGYGMAKDLDAAIAWIEKRAGLRP